MMACTAGFRGMPDLDVAIDLSHLEGVQGLQGGLELCFCLASLLLRFRQLLLLCLDLLLLQLHAALHHQPGCSGMHGTMGRTCKGQQSCEQYTCHPLLLLSPQDQACGHAWDLECCCEKPACYVSHDRSCYCLDSPPQVATELRLKGKFGLTQGMPVAQTKTNQPYAPVQTE